MRKEKLEELHSYIELLKCKRKKLLENYNNFLKIEKYECELNNGHNITREKLVKGNKDGSAAIVFPVTKEEESLLIVQPRVFNKNTIGIELPAGYIEKNETPKDAAIRELEEETGYIPKDLIHLAGYYQDQGISAAFNHSFLALGCDKKTDQHLDNDEFIKYFTCTYGEVLELANMGYINDANSIIAIEKSKKYMK